MPYKPAKPCSYPGCSKLTYERYCPEHKKLMNAQCYTRFRDRGVSEFFHSSERKRQNHLIEHPFCVECWKKGKPTKASVVDHIIPIKQGGTLLEDSNLQALCASCHRAKSTCEGSRYGGQKRSE